MRSFNGFDIQVHDACATGQLMQRQRNEIEREPSCSRTVAYLEFASGHD